MEKISNLIDKIDPVLGFLGSLVVFVWIFEHYIVGGEFRKLDREEKEYMERERLKKLEKNEHAHLSSPQTRP